MRWIKGIVLVMVVVWSTGCAQTEQPYSVEPSGFMGNLYPLMREGKEDEALLVYRNPNFDKAKFRTFDKLILDPVMFWRGRESQVGGVPQTEGQQVVNDFFTLIYDELDKDYEMVAMPGPGTLRLQVAITKLEESAVVLDVVSNVPIYGIRTAGKLKELATGKPPFVGEASIEAKLSDTDSGQLIGAGVDRRVGTKTLNADSFDSWADVYATLEFWAKGMRWRFCQARGEQQCIRPEE